MNERVLFVDDDANLLASYRRQLRDQYSLDTAPDGAKGLEAVLNRGPYALVVSDFRMPVMDGLHFLSRVRESSPETVRILLTGYADLSTAIEAVNAGNIFRLLTKPCPHEALRAALEAGCRQYRLLRSERERVAREKATLEEQLRQSQKMEAMGKLTGGIAHDLNNLLTVINTTTELAVMEMPGDDPLREKFELIQRTGGRAANLTRHLLAFSRRDVAESKVFDLNTLVQELGKMLRRVIREDIALEMNPAPEPANVKADPGQVEQAILNLAINARDAMPSGGKLTVEIARADAGPNGSLSGPGLKPGRYIILSVRDTGTGMPPEVRKRIFEPFFTTKGKGEGTGLGLSIVEGIIKEAGGSVLVESAPEQGTTFRLCFPEVSEMPAEERFKSREAKMRGRHETILVVEDEPEVRRVVVEILSRQGYNVLEAPNGKDALGLCEGREGTVEVLLTDIVMPEVNGLDLARQLTFRYPAMRVLFMSGYTGEDFVSMLMEEKRDFLQKPFSVEDLTGRIHQILNVSRGPAALYS